MTVTTEDCNLTPEVQVRVNRWLEGDYDEATKQQLKSALKHDAQRVADAFYTDLTFGTGGLRGLMGVGTNRMNRYTVRRATAGLSQYLNELPGEHSVAISYDSRQNSRLFAEEAARVLAAAGIKAILFKELRPTPLLSFAVRYLGCSAGVMVTASHNPPAYNGYKLYWNDGAQVLPPHDKEVIDRVNAIQDLDQIPVAPLDSPMIIEVGEEIDAAYYEAIDPLQLCPEDNAEKGHMLQLVYSNLHGAGTTMVPAVLNRWGFTQVQQVESQREPDGAFPTTASPNPEDREALQIGIQQMLDSGADLLLATDPDVDRVGIAVQHNGQAVLLNGNQIACVCLEHVCQKLSRNGKLPPKIAFIKTIVTSELFKTIAQAYGGHCVDVLTGFKYVADVIRKWEQSGEYQFVFGGEESYGYLRGTHVRDKDAVISCALISEVALQAKLRNETLVDMLNAMYRKYGIFREKLLCLKFPETQEGRTQMGEGMERLRSNPPQELAGVPVARLLDYQQGVNGLPRSNVLRFELQDGAWLVVRPSGTEPKVKLYCGVTAAAGNDLDASVAQTDARVDQTMQAVKSLLS